MTAPLFRSIPTHPASMVVTIREIDEMRDEIARLQAQLKDEKDGARVEIDNLTDLLKASGTHVANLSSGLAMYQVERDEYREQAEEYRDRFDLAIEERDEARIRVQELETELGELKRETAWMTGVTQ